MKPWLGLLLLALLLVACRAPQRPSAQQPVPSSVPALAAGIAADAKRSDTEHDASTRAALAAEANSYAEACLVREPQAAACLYGEAIARGLTARVHPTRAGELLGRMLEDLKRAEAADPLYDEAGPARVQALVLVRAPGWPLGPGDADAGLTAARRAVNLRPQYPANLLALAEALAKTGDIQSARQYYEQARAQAAAMQAVADKDAWLREADEGLKHLPPP